MLWFREIISTFSGKKDSKCHKAEKQKAMGWVVEQSHVIVLRVGASEPAGVPVSLGVLDLGEKMRLSFRK